MRKMAVFLTLTLALAPAPSASQTHFTPVDISVFIDPDPNNLLQTLPLLYAAKQLPDRVKVTVKFASQPEIQGSDTLIRALLQFLYVQKKFPEKTLDYVLCAQYDPPRRSCDAILKLDWAGYPLEERFLLNELDAQVAEAKTLGAESSPAVYINGLSYDRTLYLGELLPYIDTLLPASQRIPGITRSAEVEPIPLYALGVEKGVGARDVSWERSLLRYFENLKIVPVDAQSKAGRSFLKKTDARSLPVYYFDDALSQKQPELFKMFFERNLAAKKGGYTLLHSRSGQSQLLLGRVERPNEMALFVRSQCPLSVQAEAAFIQAFKEQKLPKDFRLKLRFIVDKDDSKQWTSLRGKPELDEDIRQLLIQKHFPDKFLAYLEARNKDYKSERWEEAARAAGVDPEAVKSRMAEGEGLLGESYELAGDLSLSETPTFLWENKYLVASHRDLKHLIGLDPYEGLADITGNP